MCLRSRWKITVKVGSCTCLLLTGSLKPDPCSHACRRQGGEVIPWALGCFGVGILLVLLVLLLVAWSARRDIGSRCHRRFSA